MRYFVDAGPTPNGWFVIGDDKMIYLPWVQTGSDKRHHHSYYSSSIPPYLRMYFGYKTFELFRLTHNDMYYTVLIHNADELNEFIILFSLGLTTPENNKYILVGEPNGDYFHDMSDVIDHINSLS